MSKIGNADQVHKVRLRPQDLPHAHVFNQALQNARQLGPNLTTKQKFKLQQNHFRFAVMAELPNHDIHRLRPVPRKASVGVITRVGGFFGL
jgi:hypothetical protein